MDIFKIIGIGIITCIAVLIVKPIKPEIALVVGLAGGILIVFMIVDMLSQVMAVFTSIVDKTGFSKSLFSTILKIVGVGYLTEFSANLCEDSGNSSIANKILLGGKILILCVSLPVINSLLELIMELIKWKIYI